MRLRIYTITLKNYFETYEIPLLEGYDDIESIFPEEDPKSEKKQELLSGFFNK
jgi:hypothetical protein